MAATNVVPLPRRKPRAPDIVADAIEAGSPLPLSVMLKNLEYWHAEAERLTSSNDPPNLALARIARAQAQRCACDAAPFVHPKLANTVISGDDENPIKVEHEHASYRRFDQLTDERAAELLDAINKGTLTIEQVHDELA